jgi:hypothetical protein
MQGLFSQILVVAVTRRRAAFSPAAMFFPLFPHRTRNERPL